MPMPRSVAGAVCAVLLLALFAGLSIWEMSGDSLTPDERAHLPAGYAYWVAGEFRLNPEHPPFVKLLCAAPLLFMDLKVPPTGPPAGVTFHNYIAKFGTAFLSQGLDRILFWGRLPVVGLGLLLGSLVYSWSRRIHGSAGAGLVSTFLLALEPTLLAHSHLVTTDVALACFTIMAFSFLWRFCEAGGDGRHLVLAVAGMGLALASKFSAVVVLPLFLLLWFRRWPARAPAAGDRRPVADRLLAGPGPAAAAALLGIAFIIQACYFFSPDPSLYFKGLEAVRANKPVNYAAYAAGSFFVGGRWWYALYVFFLKTPLATLCVIGAAVVVCLRDRARAGGTLLFVLLPAVFYAAAVCLFADNYGVRYMIPVTAFLLVIAGRAWSLLEAGRARRLAGAALALWLAVSVGRVSPHYIAYCNEIIGGPENGARFMHDSNLDWGQDLKRLARYQQDRNLPPLVLAFWGASRPEVYGIRYSRWAVDTPDEADPPVAAEPPPGVYAISVNKLIDLKKLVRLEGRDPRLDWLDRFKPADRVGYSIYIYRFP